MSGDTVAGSTEHPLDDLPGMLNGELSPERDAAVAAHLADCDYCRRELVIVAQVSSWLHDASRLPFAEPLELPPLQVQPTAAQGGRRIPLRGRRLVAACAAAVVLVGGGAAGAVVVGDHHAGSGPRTTATVALRGATASGRAAMVGTGEQQVMKVSVTGLPAPAAKHHYEVWLLDTATQRMLAVGVLPPDGQGRYSVPAGVSGGYDAIDVSYEAVDAIGHAGPSVAHGSLA